MSLKINFFPLHFIISILVLITTVIVFSDTVYLYMSSNIYINGLIVSLFIFCMIWILGVLSYYSRSAKVINKLFSGSVVGDGGKGSSMYVPSSIAGTIIDNPVASKVLSSFSKSGKIEVNYSDALTIVESAADNGDRVLGPSKFLASLFTMLGLFGTFVGLLETIDGVGLALNSLSDSDNVDIFALVGLLAQPLNGMSVAFSTSLFGLVSALFANYGNYVASQQLAVFINKLKNFLTAATGVSSIDPTEIKAEDILLALEDSFNKLSVTFAEKLDAVSEGLFVMSKVIARGQDRQEKLSKAMLINLVKLDKLNILEELAEDISEIIEENRIEFFKYLDGNVINRLDSISNSLEVSNRISTDKISILEKTGIIAEDLARMTESLVNLTENTNSIIISKSDIIDASLKSNGDLLEQIVDSTEDALPILESIDGKTTGIDYRSSFDDVIATIEESNELAKELNSLSDESNNLSDTLINRVATEDTLNATVSAVDNVNSSVDDAISELENHRNILNNTLDAMNDIGDEVNGNLSKIIDLNDGILAEVTEANPIYRDMLEESIKSNELSNDSINIANDSLDELVKSNELSNDRINIANDYLSELVKSNELSNDRISIARDSLDELVKSNELSNDRINIARDSLDVIISSDETLSSMRITAENSDNSLVDINNNLSSAVILYEESLTKLTNIDEILSEQLPLLYNLEQYADAILNNEEQSVSLLDNLNTQLERMTSGFSMFLPVMTEVMGVVRDEMDSLNNTVDLLGNNIEILGNNISNMSQDLMYNAEAIARFGEIVSVLDIRMENLDYSSTALNESLQQLLPRLYESIEISANNSEYLSQLIGTLGYVVQTAEGIGQFLSDFANTILQENAHISDRVATVSEVMMDSTDRITQSLDQTFYSLAEVSSKISESANQSMEIANNNAMAADAMMSVVSEFSQLRDLYSDQMTEISNLLSDTISSVMQATDYVSSNLVDINSLVTQVESYSYDVMNTQESIREAVQNMLSIQEYTSNSQDNFLNSLNSTVDYTASMFADGMNSVIERLDNVNMLTEVQTYKLENLDYRLSELPETVSQMFMSLGDMVNGMQNMMYEIMSQNSQAQTAIMEAVSDNRDANSMVMSMIEQTSDLNSVISNLASQSEYTNSMVMSMVEQTSDLNSMISNLASQSEYANSMVGNLSSNTEALQSSINMLTDSFAGVYGSMVDTSENMSNVANSLLSISGEMATQVDALERNSIISTNLSADLQSLAFSNESLRDVGNSLVNIVNSFENLSSVLSGVQISSENMDRTFANYSDILFGEIARLTQTLNSHLDMFMSKDFSLGQDMFNIMNNVSSAINDISHAISTFDSLASDSIIANREVKNQLENSMNYAISEIASIKENLGNNMSERIVQGITQISYNQGEMMDRLNYVMPQINNLIDTLSRNSFGNSLSQGTAGYDNSDNVIDALISLRDEHQNGNARLDIMANAVDTLITEILNSRDVAETILDVVTRIAGLTRK